MEKQPLAVVTMAYNETVLLPIWLRHYERQVGLEHCYIIDHGSDDASTKNIRANIIRLPRTPMDEDARAAAVRDFCSALFLGYNRVLYTDADELVVPDPNVSPTLKYCAATQNLPRVLTLFGVDVVHVAEEAQIDLSVPISHQRQFARPISTLCKPTLIAGRIDWMHGFHCIIGHHRPSFGDIFLFHIAHCDIDILYERQKKRNATAPIGLQHSHHTITPDVFVNHIRSEVALLPRRDVQMQKGEPHFERTKLRFSDAIERKDWSVEPDLWRIPARFAGAF